MKYFPKYDKSVSRRKKFMAHDENCESKLGDIVRIVPCRPMSTRKRHALIDILRRPKLSLEEEEALTRSIEKASEKASKASTKPSA